MQGFYLRNNVQLRNYALVQIARDLESRGVKVYKDDEWMIGCIYNEDGTYTKHYLKPDLDNVAKFICSSNKDKLLVSIADYALTSTMGIYLDLAIDDFREKILPYLEKYQCQEKFFTFEEIR